jgi:hypothetical protein
MRAIRIWTDGNSSRWRKWVAQRENQERGKHEICLHCRAPISSCRMSLREKTVTALSGNLLDFFDDPSCLYVLKLTARGG